MIRKFTRTVTVEFEYSDPYGVDDNAWDAMHEYTPIAMAEEDRKGLSLGEWFKSTNYTLIDDEIKFISESEGPWCGSCNKPLDNGENHNH